MERFNEAQSSLVVSTIFPACATGKQQHMFKFGSTALMYNLSTLTTERTVTSDERTFVMMPVAAKELPALTIIRFVSVLLWAQLYNKDRFTRFGRSQVSAVSSKEALLLSSRWWGAVRCLMTAIPQLGAPGGFIQGQPGPDMRRWGQFEKMIVCLLACSVNTSSSYSRD